MTVVNNPDELGQAKRHDRKVYITDVAISKVPFVEYFGFTKEQSQIMQELAKDVLVISKESNDSNEVAITCDLGTSDPLHNFGVALGTEHDVDVLSDTLSNHMIVSEKSVAVVLLHNHPSTQTFSLQDIQFFVQHPMIEVMTIVSNQGTVHYMKRDKNYDYAKTFELFSACVGRIDGKASSVEMYMASLEFLAKCSEAGLYYR
ncbi:MAG: hypothetical protein NC413_00350 [Muribaculum sp.]|nr:hypothetical protein [Muribaculum sp.]